MAGSEFAVFSEGDGGDAWIDVLIRPVRASDVATVSALLADREHVSESQARETVSAWVRSHPLRLVLVGEARGRVHGYGKAEWLAPSDEGGVGPTGWYLTGLVVAPTSRRHGIGRRLTVGRIDALAPLTDVIWYVANLRNRTTIALHEHVGFVLHAESFSIPGVEFSGGRGALFRLPV